MRNLKCLLIMIICLAAFGGAAQTAWAKGQKLRFDRSFGHGGKITWSPQGDSRFGSHVNYVNPDFVRADSRGRIVVAALVRSGSSHLVVLRFLPGGRPDTTFGPRGARVLGAYGSSDFAGMAVDSRNRIVVTYTDVSRSAPQSINVFVARFLPDGTLDPAFGGTGVVEAAPTPNNRAAGLALAPSDGVTVGFRRSEGSGGGVIRLNENGSVDPSFAYPLGANIFSPTAIAPTTNGFALAGYYNLNSETSTVSASAVEVIGQDGALDQGFGSNGFRTIPGSVSSVGHSGVGLLPVAGGFVGAGSGKLVRLDRKSKIVSSFGSNGTVRLPYAQSNKPAYMGAFGLDSRGRIFAGGSKFDLKHGGTSYLIRYRPNGSIDRSGAPVRFGFLPRTGSSISSMTPYTGDRMITASSYGRITRAGTQTRGARGLGLARFRG